MKARGNAKGIALRVDVQPPSMAVEADPTAIARC
jgi:hypothetical protein